MRTIAERLAYNRRNSKELNPLLFNEEGQLKPEIREKILQIVDEFFKYAEVDTKILDVRLVGSNAAYNYNPDSDLDIHVVVDLSKISDPESIARLYFDSVKSNFKDAYDITIKGIDVEIYVEDVNTSANSNGIYSVTQDKWIKEPTQEVEPTSDQMERAEEIEDQIIQAIEDTNDAEGLEKIIDDLYLMRKDSLAQEGEAGAGNLAFKSLRNKGILDKIKDVLRDDKSKELSLESKDLKESAGDITLRKFIYIYSNPISEAGEFSKYYNEELSGYYIEWDYHYNTLTKENDDKEVPHSSMIEALPTQLKSMFRRDKGVWGREDYTTKIKKYVSDKPDGIPDEVYNRLVRYFKEDK